MGFLPVILMGAYRCIFFVWIGVKSFHSILCSGNNQRGSHLPLSLIFAVLFFSCSSLVSCVCVLCLVSYVLCHVYCVFRLVSRALCLVSCVLCLVSCVLCLASCGLCAVSLVLSMCPALSSTTITS